MWKQTKGSWCEVKCLLVNVSFIFYFSFVIFTRDARLTSSNCRNPVVDWFKPTEPLHSQTDHFTTQIRLEEFGVFIVRGHIVLGIIQIQVTKLISKHVRHDWSFIAWTMGTIIWEMRPVSFQKMKHWHGKCSCCLVIWGVGSKEKPEGFFPVRKETKLRRIIIEVGGRCSFITIKKGNTEVVHMC